MIDVAIRALAEPRRREILALVRDRELPAGEIARRFDVSRPAISQHLAVLKDAGLVTERRLGTRRLYRARPEGARELRSWLEGFWDDRLARLKTVAEAAAATRARKGTKEDSRSWSNRARGTPRSASAAASRRRAKRSSAPGRSPKR